MSKRRPPAPKFPKASAERQRLWSAVRQLRRFSLDDAVAVTACTATFVTGRLDEWSRFGIVRRDNDGWRLALDLGPLPPWGSPKSKAMIDRNKGGAIALLAKEERPNRNRGQKRPGTTERNRRRAHRFVAEPLMAKKPPRIWMDADRSAQRLAPRRADDDGTS